MKREIGLLFLFALLVAASCGTVPDGELRGVPGREFRAEPEPYNMARIPRGAFTMGRNDEDVTWSHRAPTKTVSVEAFWIDAAEISNNQYRQFVFYVRDSLLRRVLLRTGNEDFMEPFTEAQEEAGQTQDTILNWDEPISADLLEDPEVSVAVQNALYYSAADQFEGRNEIDTRKLNYEFQWIDLKQAAQQRNRYDYSINRYGDSAEVFYFPKNTSKKVENRKDFIIRDRVNVYPDTLAWISDFTYSFNEPMAKNYFWHPNYDNYPVVGVTWRQAFAFCVWRTEYLNKALRRRGEPTVHDFRLPTEAEWEYAARGGLASGMYPWGSYYTRSKNGCLLANFKPMRGRYAEDGGLTTLPVTSMVRNSYGLWGMAGNVAEWTSSAYDESSYSFTHDMNPDYQYNARPNDPPAMKRKVVRGGSWKDIAFFVQLSTRTYEYQDTAKTYIGFRCVRSSMIGDDDELVNSDKWMLEKEESLLGR